MKFSYQVGMCEPNHYLPLAIAAEEAGFDGITIPDSICYPEEASSKYPYNEDGSREFLESVPFVESLIAVTAMAAVTSEDPFRDLCLQTGGPPGTRGGEAGSGYPVIVR